MILRRRITRFAASEWPFPALRRMLREGRNMPPSRCLKLYRLRKRLRLCGLRGAK